MKFEEFLSPGFWESNLKTLLNWAIHALPLLAFTLILMLITSWLFSRMVKRLKKIMMLRVQHKYQETITEHEKRINTLAGILNQAGKIVIWVVFIMILLREVSLDIGPILASAGIVGLAVGFGAQELVKDFISGFFMLLENQIREGDVAVINGTAGTVETIALRTISLRDFSGTVHIFQHGKIDSLSNMTKDWSAAVFDIGVAYKEDIAHVRQVIQRVGDELFNDEQFKEVIAEPIEIFGLDKLGDSAVVIKARFKTKPAQQWMVGREFNARIKNAFDAEGIEIPFPHRTIYWGEAISPLRLKVEDTKDQKTQ